ISAFAVDVGQMFADRRKAQSTADLAAIAAASDLVNAERAAGATVARNNLPAGALQSVVLGIYDPNPALPPSQRFQPAPASLANAAQISLRTTTPLFLGRLLAGRDRFEVRTRAVASQTAFASFAIGSGLASIEGGVANQLLGAMLGTSLSLSVM